MEALACHGPNPDNLPGLHYGHTLQQELHELKGTELTIPTENPWF